MKKFFLLVVIVLNIAVFCAAAFLIYNRVMQKEMPPAQGASMSKLGAGAPLALPGESSKAAGSATPGVLQPSSSTVSAPAVNPGSGSSAAVEPAVRNIQFAFHNSKAKQVSIRADFAGWKAQAMHKDASGKWVFQAALPPGEYAYCFIVDGKAIRDPAAKRSKVIGQTTVSAVVVNPLPPRS